jgi:hypothetical protein
MDNVVTYRGLPEFLGNRHRNGGEVASLTRQQTFSPRKIPATAERIRSIENPNDLIWNESIDLPL